MPNNAGSSGPVNPRGDRPLLSVADALSRILSGLQPVETETVNVQDSVARVLAMDLISNLTLPSHDTSSMDGYAVRGADIVSVPHQLVRVGESAAGHPWTGTLGAGHAVRIFTGAHLPPGADTVVLQEDCDATDERDGADIQVNEAPKISQFVRPAGLDVQAGTTVIPKGTSITARSLALAISVGHTHLTVTRKPRIGILSTGDELVQPGDALLPGQIISSNADYLSAFVTACGAVPVHLGIAADKAGAALDKIRNSPTPIDMVVTTGGASVGTHDHILDDITAAGGTLTFWKIAMRPGKPLISGIIDGIPLLGLPGNPVSSAVCTLVFLQPAIYALSGNQSEPRMIATTLTTDLPANDKRQDYLRAIVETQPNGMPLATPATRQDSSMISVLATADGLMVRPPFDPPRKAGETMQLLLFPDHI